MMLLAIGAGLSARAAAGAPAAGVIFGAVALFALLAYGLTPVRHTGARAPETILAEDGHPISLSQGKVFLYFFNPQCAHCLEAGRRLAVLDWGDTRFVGVPTENPQFGDWFMGKAGLTRRGPSPKIGRAAKNLPLRYDACRSRPRERLREDDAVTVRGPRTIGDAAKIGFVH